jgi:hypothetical protein
VLPSFAYLRSLNIPAIAMPAPASMIALQKNIGNQYIANLPAVNWGASMFSD